MRLYATVRVLRGVVLATATHEPSVAALASELTSVLPLCARLDATLGGVLALTYAGDLAGAMAEILEQPMRRRLRVELVLLCVALTACWFAGV